MAQASIVEYISYIPSPFVGINLDSARSNGDSVNLLWSHSITKRHVADYPHFPRENQENDPLRKVRTIRWCVPLRISCSKRPHFLKINYVFGPGLSWS